MDIRPCVTDSWISKATYCSFKCFFVLFKYHFKSLVFFGNFIDMLPLFNGNKIFFVTHIHMTSQPAETWGSMSSQGHFNIWPTVNPP